MDAQERAWAVVAGGIPLSRSLVEPFVERIASAIREAEADALERAARLAERVRTGDAPWAPHQVADAVRSLKETTPDAKGGGK